MHGRLLAVALGVVLAGCSGAIPADPTGDAETVTAVPVPVDADDDGVPWIVEDGANGSQDRVNGTRLGAAHADSIGAAHTRIVHYHVSGGDGVYLDFRETRAVDASNRSLRTRFYEGPGTARFVPDEADATTVRSERYATDSAVGQRRTVDGRTERVRASGPAPPASPFPELDAADLVAALLGNASVIGWTPGGDIRLAGDAVAPPAVPAYLEDPRSVTVRAEVGTDGYVPHVSVRYLASLDGENVSVTMDLYWLSRSDSVDPPAWYEGETAGER